MPSYIDSGIDEIVKGLLNWAEDTLLYGRDPYTVRELTDKILYYSKSNIFIYKILSKIIDKLIKLNIVYLMSRKVFIPKSAGLLLQSISRLKYLDYQNKNLGDLEKNMIRLINASRSRTASGTAWGIPFTWYTHIVFPPGTPFMSVTHFVGEGLIDAFIFLDNRDAYRLYIDIPRFIMNELNIIRYNNGICFSYSPRDRMPIHNSNLMAVEHLLTGYLLLGKDIFLRYAINALKFTLSEIREDGSLCYFSQHYNRLKKCKQDFHSGFELSSLINIYYLLKTINYNRNFLGYLVKCINKRASFIINNIVDKNNVFLYKIIDDKKILDIQDTRSYSAIIVSLIRYYNLIKNNELIKLIIKMIYRLNNLLYLEKKKYYAYRYYLLKRGSFRERVFYPRMGVAWPLRALTEYLLLRSGRLGVFYKTRYSVLRGISPLFSSND